MEVKVGYFYRHRHMGDLYEITSVSLDRLRVSYKMVGSCTIIYTTERENFESLFSYYNP